MLSIMFTFILSFFFNFNTEPHKKVISVTIPEEEIIIQNIAPEMISDI